MKQLIVLAKQTRGFSLMELMVVVLIIAILMAISIPTFMGARKSAFDSNAKQFLTNVSKAEAAVYAESGLKQWADAEGMTIEEPKFQYIDGDPVLGKVSIVLAPDKKTGMLRTLSESGAIIAVDLKKGGQVSPPY
ncbi:MAG: prepilin-type N-terminal cleavage/methylation domain-containing protein [Actinobacteria bacterium]|nr:MAG: prepilin-type N-terminal cleavage/methylation domain-containing protein [Actinomycetota bacterium]